MFVTSSGSFDNIERWLKKVKGNRTVVESFSKRLCDSLKARTPTRTGKTAASWSYRITQTINGYEIEIINTNVNKGVCIAKILHYGHGTGTGGYVPGTHYITKAIDAAYSVEIKKVLESMIK